MAKFRLVFDPDSIERRASRPAVGKVHVLFGAKAFPEREWTDFALEFLSDYLAAITKLRTAAKSKVSFFDGPYELRFVRTGDDVSVAAHDRRQREAVFSTSVPYTDLLQSSMQAIIPWVDHEIAVGA